MNSSMHSSDVGAPDRDTFDISPAFFLFSIIYTSLLSKSAITFDQRYIELQYRLSLFLNNFTALDMNMPSYLKSLIPAHIFLPSTFCLEQQPAKENRLNLGYMLAKNLHFTFEVNIKVMA